MATRRLYSDLDLNGLRIINSGTPTANTDLANKVYVDAELSAAVNDATTLLRGEFGAADTAIRTDFASADTALRAAFEGADTAIRADFAAADAALRAELAGTTTTNPDGTTSTTNGLIQTGDNAVRSEFAAADTALRTAFETADDDLLARIDAVSAANTNDTTTLRSEIAAGDNAVRGEFAAADTSIRTDFAAADTQIRRDLNGYTTTTTNPDGTTSSTFTAGAIQTGDDAVRGEFAAADTAIRTDFAAADTAIRTDFTAADTALGGRIDALAGGTADEFTAVRGEFAAADAANLQTARNEISAGDAAARAYADSLVAGLTSGQVLKGSVRVAATENVPLADVAPVTNADGTVTPGETAPTVIQGETLVDGDLVLLTAQDPGTENGPYRVTITPGTTTTNADGTTTTTAATATYTRASNWDTAAEAVVGSYWVVREGTHADQFALLTNDTFALGTDVAQFLYISAIPEGIPPVVQAIGGQAAGTAYTVNHTFGLETVVQIHETATGQDVTPFISWRKTVNTIVVEPDVALAVDELTVTIARARG